TGRAVTHGSHPRPSLSGGAVGRSGALDAARHGRGGTLHPRRRLDLPEPAGFPRWPPGLLPPPRRAPPGGVIRLMSEPEFEPDTRPDRLTGGMAGTKKPPAVSRGGSFVKAGRFRNGSRGLPRRGWPRGSPRSWSGGR